MEQLRRLDTIKQGQFTATITEDEEPMPPKFLTDIQDAEVSGQHDSDHDHDHPRAGVRGGGGARYVRVPRGAQARPQPVRPLVPQRRGAGECWSLQGHVTPDT